MVALEQMVGIGAGILTGISLLPQLIKIVQEKKSESVSWGMLLVLMAGLAGWVWYGALKKDLPILITNSFSILVNIAIMILSLIYKKPTNQ